MTQKTSSGNRTVTTKIIGFFSCIFCSASVLMEEQEATRFLLLSPEISQDKEREKIILRAERDGDTQAFRARIEGNPDRQSLKKRILAIRQAKIDHIIVDPEYVHQLFLGLHPNNLRPRYARDVGRIISIIKALALVNLWFRRREGSTLYANKNDILNGFNIWSGISEPQELGISPYVLDLFKKVIKPVCLEKDNQGVPRQEIYQRYFDLNKLWPVTRNWEKEIFPALVQTGLIEERLDPDRKRRYLVFLKDENAK